MENKESRLWLLIAKKIAGEADAAELCELGNLLNSFDLPPVDEQILNKLWKQPLENPENHPIEIDKNYNSLSQILFPEKSNLYVTTEHDENNQNQKENKKRNKVWLYAAASVIIIISTLSAAYYYNFSKGNMAVTKETDLPNQVASRKGAKTSIVLPEGTKVWLNAGSKIYYNNNFSTNREVFLVGEAYFDVKHDASNPFIIHAANVNIKVLGTAFNVKAYPTDDRVETALVRGSVELTTNDDPGRKILLRPNEKIAILKVKTIGDTATTMPVVILPKKEELYIISLMQVDKKDNVAEDVAWMQDKLVFKGETFEQLAIKMERWYDVKISFETTDCSKIKFTGAFEKQNIVQALEALSFSCNYKFVYKTDKNIINIKSK